MRRTPLWPALVLVAIALLVALFTFKDYGISVDEVLQRSIGAVNAIYINEKLNYRLISKEKLSQMVADNVQNSENFDRYMSDESLKTFKDRDYGPVFELYLLAVEKGFRLSDKRDIYLARHLATHVAFLVALLVFYAMLLRLTQNYYVALLGCVAMLLSPRIYADSFYNSKDIPFMCAYMAGHFTLMRFSDRLTWKNAVLHGLVCALGVAIRIPGIMLVAFTLGLLFIEYLKTEKTLQIGMRFAGHTLLYLAVFGAFVVACWPFLWEAPLENILFAYQNMSKFRWFGEIPFAGQWYFAHQNLPFFFAPGWITISTPPFYILGFILSMAIAIGVLFRNGWRIYGSPEERYLFQMLGGALLPLLAVIVAKSTLYNGWRQLYFVYPCLLAAAVYGWYRVHLFLQDKWPKGGWLVPVATSLSFVFTLAFMWQAHPHHQVYFNVLAGKHPDLRYEYDYWRLSSADAVAFAALQHPEPEVHIFANGFVGAYTSQMLPADLRKKVHYTDSIPQADFVVTVFGVGARNQHVLDSLGLADMDPVFNISVGEGRLATVHQIRK